MSKSRQEKKRAAGAFNRAREQKEIPISNGSLVGFAYEDDAGNLCLRSVTELQVGNMPIPEAGLNLSLVEITAGDIGQCVLKLIPSGYILGELFVSFEDFRKSVIGTPQEKLEAIDALMRVALLDHYRTEETKEETV